MVAALLAGCGVTPGDFSERAYQPLSPQLMALMQEKGTTPQAPMLIRAFKKEAEVQVWKMGTNGHYVLLKSYPICRWSGQLGPKTREGDRQVPEGFYTITPAQMNPRSNYYLSFNVGYPNAYDRAHDYTGGEIMVHGACSSAGCFSMTDQQIAEIYAIAREAFKGGQREIQMQSYPFHMTAENFAKYRLDPNIAFWRELKVGNDNFEVTKQEVAVGVCNDHYVFNAEPANGGSFDPTGPCPALKRNEDVALAVAAKEAEDRAKVAELVADGVQPIRTVYADGGQNARFAAHRDNTSRPDALAEGELDVPLDENRGYRAPSHARLEAEKRKAEEAARIAERKAAAAHAFAYVAAPAPVLAPRPAAAAMPAPNAQASAQTSARLASGAPQGHTFGLNMGALSMPSFGHFFGGQTQQAASPAPQPVAQQPAPAPTSPNQVNQNQMANTRQVDRPTLAHASTSASVPSSGPSITTSAGPATTADRAVTNANTTQAVPPAPPGSAEAGADAAKAAYAKPLVGQETSSSSTPAASASSSSSSPTSFLSQGFSAFAGGDH